MSGVSALSTQHQRRRTRRYTLIAVAVLAIVAGMALDTKVVKKGSVEEAQQGFSAATYGDKTFPEIKSDVESRAVDASELAAALAANKQEAVQKYGVGTPMPVFPVRFQGIVGEGKSGMFAVQVAGLPENVKVRLQTGPILTGTELRDATGKIQFGSFTNQIEYQNAGTAINQTLKTQLLDKLDRNAFTGKQVDVVGVFRMINPTNWLVTPVSLEVK
ncbi:hypothetical protein CIG19_00145 [Enterobacterales bacterium CwR94]|nr:hypothetical protein CIG19_00145 [Enterobacterales bacterium CwR94]